jgi:hypothetical protein
MKALFILFALVISCGGTPTDCNTQKCFIAEIRLQEASEHVESGLKVRKDVSQIQPQSKDGKINKLNMKGDKCLSDKEEL